MINDKQMKLEIKKFNPENRNKKSDTKDFKQKENRNIRQFSRQENEREKQTKIDIF